MRSVKYHSCSKMYGGPVMPKCNIQFLYCKIEFGVAGTAGVGAIQAVIVQKAGTTWTGHSSP